MPASRHQWFHQVNQQFIATAVLFVKQFGRVVMRTHAQETCRQQCILLLSILRWTSEHFIAGQLLGDEAIIRFVLVERTNHVIAVSISLRPKLVPVETVAIAVTSHIYHMRAQ